jgi:octaprenyl-diphosphate synthase
MVDTVKNNNDNDEAVQRLIAKVTEAGGIAHAHSRMLEYRDRALEVLGTFPGNDARTALEGLVQMTVDRKR